MASQYANTPDLMASGIDASSKAGALLLCRNIRRYWAQQGWDMPVHVTMSETGVRTEIIEKGRPRTIRETIYGPATDVVNARPLDKEARQALLAWIDAGYDLDDYVR